MVSSSVVEATQVDFYALAERERRKRVPRQQRVVEKAFADDEVHDALEKSGKLAFLEKTREFDFHVRHAYKVAALSQMDLRDPVTGLAGELADAIAEAKLERERSGTSDKFIRLKELVLRYYARLVELVELHKEDADFAYLWSPSSAVDGLRGGVSEIAGNGSAVG